MPKKNVFRDDRDEFFLTKGGHLYMRDEHGLTQGLVARSNIPEFVAWLSEEHGEYEAKRQQKEESDDQS